MSEVVRLTSELIAINTANTFDSSAMGRERAAAAWSVHPFSGEVFGVRVLDRLLRSC